MNITASQALGLYENRQYTSYRFQLFDATGQNYYLRLTKDEVKNHSHQFVTLSEYNQSKINNVNSYYYGYNNHYHQLRYTFSTPAGDLHGYLRKDNVEGKEFVEFLTLITEFPKSYQCYFGDLAETEKYIDLLIFIDTNLFAQTYQTNKHLSKNMIRLFQKYALNQYKVYNLRDCSDEEEFQDISSDFLLKLFDYQKQTLTWMKRIETADYKFLVPTSTFFKLSDRAYIELIQKQSNTLMSQYVYENDYRTDEMIRCRGGILADRPGAGKTISCIAHIYHNRPICLPLLTSIIEREVYVPSRATLVVCPTNLASQWESEIAKCLGSNLAGLRVIKIDSKAKLNKYSLDQLVNADIIITTYTFLTHTGHIGTGFIKKGRVGEFLSEQKQSKTVHGDKYHLYKNYTLLFLKYNRIIYDEFHEEIDTNSTQNSMLYVIKNCLKAKYTWGVSGTPLLENEKILDNISGLLHIVNTNNDAYDLDVISQHEVFDRFVRRNEKQYLPAINYKTINVKQTVQERQLYDSSISQPMDVLMQLCCYHNINSLGLQSIDEVASSQEQLRQKQKLKLIEQIDDLKINLKQIETVLKSLNPKVTKISDLYYLIDSKHPQHTHALIQQIQKTPTLQLQVDSLRQYRKYEKQIENHGEELKKLEQCISYYDQTLKNSMANGQFICPITGEAVGDGEVVITKQGHLFSKDAIEMLFEFGDGKYITCPVTQMQLGRGDISIVTNKKQTTDNLSNNERVFGSKITAIINSINALSADKKIIIFGAWEKFLNTIAYALAQNNINYVAIKGNVNIRDKAIKEFQKNPAVRVILLSSEFGASGLNLTQATEVFITHPFLGEDGHQGEKQAISRAHRTGQTKEVNVSFFITDQTIESEIWEKNRKNNYSNTVQMKMPDEPDTMTKV